MYLIVGLGNPGEKYAHTRHNMGFDVIDELASTMGVDLDTKKFKGHVGQGRIGSEKVLLLKPDTFMNLSGDSVSQAIQFYKIDPEEELIVISDDINLDVGRLRIRAKGSAGGHNGLKDIIAKCGTQNFKRIRVGVGMKEQKDLAKHVLSTFRKEDQSLVKESIEKAAKAASGMIIEGTETAMNLFN